MSGITKTGLGRGFLGLVGSAVIAMPGAVMAQTAPPAESPASGAVSEQLPSADEVFEKYLEATGGLDAHLAHETRLYRGTIEATPGDYFALLTLAMRAPDKMMLKIEQPGSATSATFYDGTHGWIENGPESVLLIVGRERLRDLVQSARFHTIAGYKEFYRERQTQRSDVINGTPVWQVVVTSMYGKPEAHYFDKETGLLIATDQQVTLIPEQDGAEPQVRVMRSLFSGYEQIDGVLMFTRIEQLQGESRTTIRLSSIKANSDQFPEIAKPQSVLDALARFEEARRAAESEAGQSEAGQSEAGEDSGDSDSDPAQGG